MRRALARTALCIVMLLSTILAFAACSSKPEVTASPTTKKVEARSIYFTTMSKDARILDANEDGFFKRTADGRVILQPGMLYKVRENTVERMTSLYGGASGSTIIEYVDPDNLTLAYAFDPSNATNVEARYYCSDENVTISRAGVVTFKTLSEQPVSVFVRTTEGLLATAILRWDVTHEATPMS